MSLPLPPRSARFVVGLLCAASLFCAAAYQAAAQTAPTDTAPTDTAATEPATAATAPPPKALKYHDVLLKRPEPGYLFDRFYNTWLDDATVEDLQNFLTARAAASEATPDQLLLAFFYAKQGDDAAAIEQFRKALAANPASAQTWYHKALVESRSLEFETAIADLRKAREANPDDKLSILIDKQLGKALVRSRQTADALKVWNELLEANPADEELAEDLVELEIDEGLFDEAAALSTKLIARTNDPYLAVTRRLRLGDVHHRAGRRDDALAAYAEALDGVGHASWFEQEILSQIEQLFRREDNLAQLKSYFDELIKTHPKRVALLKRRAKLLIELGEADSAIAAFRQILELTPGDRANREEFVEALSKVGKHADAITEMRALIGQHAADAELRYRLATLLNDAKQPEEAARAVDEYVAASDKSEYAYLRAARLLERFERKDDAARIYQEMATALPDSPSAQEAYAAFLYTSDRKDDAKALWRRLADGAELNQLLHVTRALSARNEHALALELLEARTGDFDRDPLFYSQLTTAALALKQPEKAIPWARRRVDLAETTSDLEAALDQAVPVCDRADKVEEVIAELQANPRRTIQQSCLLAELHETAGDSQAADDALLAPAEQGDALAVSEQIRLASIRKDWTAAAAATRRLLDLPGGRKSIHVRRLVEFYQRDFQVNEALSWIDEWKSLSPGSTAPWITESALRSLQGDDEAARTVLKSAVRQFEDNEDLRLRLAQALASVEQWGDAERIYWQLFEETEDVAGQLRWVQELAKLAEQQGKTPQLVENFEQRRRDNRQSIMPLLALSEIHRLSDNYAERRAALMAASKIKSDDLELIHQIARIEEQEGDWEAAVATLERGVPLDKTDRTRQRIAKLHLAYGDADDGFAILFELAGGAQADPRTIESIADAMCGIQEWERAADYLTQHIVQYSTDYRLRYLLAVASEEAGRDAEAVSQFLALLGDQEEYPDVAKKQAQGPASQMNSYYDALRGIVPPGVVEIMLLSQSHYSAYSHQQQRGNPFAASARGQGAAGPGAVVSQPSTVDQVRGLAIAHLAVLSQRLEGEQAEQVVSDVQAAGVEHAAALLSMNPQQQNFEAAFADVLEKDPDDEVALALIVVRRFGRPTSDGSDHLKRAVDVFRERYPDLAFMSAIQAGVALEIENNGAEEEAGALRKNPSLETALEIAASLRKPNAMTVMALAAAFAGPPFNSQPAAIQAHYREAFSKLLVEWYPHIRNTPPYGQYAAMYVLAALTQGGDPAAYIGFLEDEVAEWRTGRHGSQAQSAQAMFGGGMPQELLASLTFPPTQLADFPASVLGVLQPEGANNRMTQMMGQSMAAEFDKEAIAKLLPEVRDPILRVLLAQRFEQPALVDSTLAELLGAARPSLDALLLAAAKDSAAEKWSDAVGHLGKARYLPMNRDMRRLLDAAMVASVLAAHDAAAGNELPADMLELGRSAALRLRQVRLDSNQRSQLVGAMETLGLTDEAKKLDQLAAAPAPQGGQLVYSTAGGYAAPAAEDRVAKLLADGKREPAVKLLSNEVLALVRQALSNPQNSSYYLGHQGRQLQQRLVSLSVVDEVLKALDPGASTNARRVTEYGVACELLGKREDARKAYESILAKRKREDAVRIRLMMLLASTDVDAAREHLTQFSPTASNLVGQSFIEQLQDYQATIEQRVACAELACDYFDIVAKEKNAQLTWSQSLISMLGGQMHTQRGATLTSIYAKERESAPGGAEAKLHERRIAAHRRLCDQMLAVPATARAGFTHALARAEAADEPEEPFLARAAETLRMESQPRPAVASGPYAVGYSVQSNRNSGDVRLRSPEEFLVRHAAEAGDWSLIDEQLLPELEKATNKTPARELANHVKLYRCEPAEFLEVAAELLRRSPGMAQGNPPAELELIVAAWAHRKLDVDVPGLVLKEAKKIVKGQNHYQPIHAAVDLIEVLAQQQGAAAATDFLEQLTELYLGPADRRADFLAKNSTQNGIQWGTPSGAIYVYSQLLSELLQRDAALFPLLGFLEVQQGFESLDSYSNVEHYTQAGFNRLLNRDAASVMAVLQKSPWLGDLSTFQPLASKQNSNSNGYATWLGWFLSQVDDKETLRTSLKEEFQRLAADKPPFGVAIIDANFRGEGAVVELIAAHLPQISALSEERQNVLASLVNDLARDVRRATGDLNANQQAVKQWLGASRARSSRTALKKLNKVKRIEDLGIQPYQINEYLSGLIRDLAPGDPAAAREAILLVVELAKDAQRRGQWNMSHGGGTSMVAALLSQGFNGLDEKTLDRVPLVLDIVGSSEGNPVEYRDSNYGVGNCLRNVMERVRQPGGDAKTIPVHEALPRFYSEVADALGDRRASVLVDELYDILDGSVGEGAEFDRSLAWAEKEAGSPDAAHADLAATLRTALAMLQARRAANSGSVNLSGVSTGEMTPAETWFAAHLADESLSLTWRVQLGHALLRRAARPLPAELARQVLFTYVAAITAGAPIPDEQQTVIVRWLMGVAREPSLNDQLAAWQDAWAKRYFVANSRGASPRPRSQFEMLNQISSNTILTSVLAVYLVRNDTPHIEELMRRFERNMGDDPVVIAQLLRANEPGLAAAHFREHWDDVSITWTNEDAAIYDDAVAQATPAFLERLADDDQRAFARVLLASMNGREKMRLARLEPLADEFPKLQFKDDRLRMRTLAVLGRYPGVSARLRESIAKAFAETDLVAAAQPSNERSWQIASELAARHFESEFRAGRTDSYVAAFDKLAAAVTSNGPNQLAQRLEQLVKICNTSIEKDGQAWTPEGCAAVSKSLRGLVAGKEYIYIGYWKGYNTAVLLTHARGSGPADELAVWSEAVSQQTKSWLSNQGVGQKFWSWAKAFVGKATPENLPERIRLVERGIRGASDANWLHWRPGAAHQMRGPLGNVVFSAIVDSGLLSRDEAVAYARQISAPPADSSADAPKEAPHFRVAACVAEWLREENLPAETAAAFERAATLAPEEFAAERRHWTADSGSASAKHGDAEKAQAALDRLAAMELAGNDLALKSRLEGEIKAVRENVKAPN